MHRDADIPEIVEALGSSRASRLFWIAGRISDIRTQMIEIATSSSIIVNPLRDRDNCNMEPTSVDATAAGCGMALGRRETASVAAS